MADPISVEALRAIVAIADARDKFATDQGCKVSHSAVHVPYALFADARAALANDAQSVPSMVLEARKLLPLSDTPHGNWSREEARRVRNLIRDVAEASMPEDVRRLIIAARRMYYDGENPGDMDAALEAFASRVPWDDEPATHPEAVSQVGEKG